MAFIVVYDANVLYPNTLRDLLIRIAQAGMVQARWTSEILDEMLGALGKNRPDIPPERLDRLRGLMNAAVRDCLVSGYEPLIEGLKLPDLQGPTRSGRGHQGWRSGHRHEESKGLPGRGSAVVGYRGEIPR